MATQTPSQSSPTPVHTPPVDSSVTVETKAEKEHRGEKRPTPNPPATPSKATDVQSPHTSDRSDTSDTRDTSPGARLTQMARHRIDMLSERARHLGDSLDSLRDRAVELTRERPMTALSLAFMAGFMLRGRLTRR